MNKSDVEIINKQLDEILDTLSVIGEREAQAKTYWVTILNELSGKILTAKEYLSLFIVSDK